ncbi:MAG: permease prefix domain 1-containing protein [Oscillospiraceae bacterium]|jgi:hypothetical protein|nr:permease prefix domain 1-containing protein [Oscillospiraceae bacterium]
METITTYLDNVFAAYEQTEDLLRLKSEMLCNMKEKYAALKQQGISENEAVGRVISDFGSIDEISSEFKIKENSAHAQKFKNHKTISKEDADEFFAEKIKLGKAIGFGVWLILFGVSVLVFIAALGEHTDLITDDAASGIGVTFMFLCIIAAVPVFIIFGIRSEKYENWEKEVILTDPVTKAEYSQAHENYTSIFALKIAAGVGLILLSVIGIILADSFGLDILTETAMPSILFFSVGAATYLFVTAGVKKEAFEILLGKGNYGGYGKGNYDGYDKNNYGGYGKGNYDGYDKSNYGLLEAVSSIYWSCILVIFLLWSFLTNDWGISWIVFPIAGLIFSIITVLIQRKNKK